MLWSEEWAQGLRAWDGLERGGHSPEGASARGVLRRSARWTAEVAWAVGFFPAPDRDYVGYVLTICKSVCALLF
jgi:hypothetical protein